MSEGHNPPNSAGEPAQDHTANARPRKYISEDEYEMQAAVTTRAELSNLSSTLTDGNAIKRAVQYRQKLHNSRWIVGFLEAGVHLVELIGLINWGVKMDSEIEKNRLEGAVRGMTELLISFGEWCGLPLAVLILVLTFLSLYGIYKTEERQKVMLRSNPLIRFLTRLVLVPLLVCLIFLIVVSMRVMLEHGKEAENKRIRSILEYFEVIPTKNLLENGINNLRGQKYIGDLLDTVLMMTAATFPGTAGLSRAKYYQCAQIASVILASVVGDVLLIVHRAFTDGFYSYLAIVILGTAGLVGIQESISRYAFGGLFIGMVVGLRLLQACQDSGGAPPLPRLHVYPDRATLARMAPKLQEAVNLLRNAASVLIYVGEDVSKQSGTHVDQLWGNKFGRFIRRMQWIFSPKEMQGWYKSKVLAPLVCADNAISAQLNEEDASKASEEQQAEFEAQADICRVYDLLKESKGNAFGVRVFTECTDGLLRRINARELLGCMRDAGCACPNRIRKEFVEQTCPICGKTLAPVLVSELGERMNEMRAQLVASPRSVVVLLLGQCNIQCVHNLLRDAAVEGVRIVQITEGKPEKRAKVHINAQPRSVLYEIVAGLEPDDDDE